MGVDIAVACALNVVLLVIIITSVVGIIHYRSEFKKCTEKESDYCYTIHCPVDDTKSGPCFGFAIRKQHDKSGQDIYFCSNDPTTAVDSKGQPVKK